MDSRRDRRSGRRRGAGGVFAALLCIGLGDMMKIGLYKLGIKDSGWTHVAIVVRDVEEENEPYVVECGWNGIQVTPYDMRIATSQCDAIQYRHLRTEYTFDQVHAL